jgi:sugar/nucleoside kinase (ribokinase family)
VGPRILSGFLAHLDVLQASESDLPALLNGDSLERFVRRFNVREMIVTRGARGATIITGERSSEIPTRPVEGSDFVGAGDVFLASYLFLRISDRGPTDAAQGAVRACIAKIEHGSIPTGFNPEEAT